MRVTIKEYKKLIKELGGNQKLIAEEIGESPQTMSNIVTGKINLKKSHILKLIGLKTVLNGEQLPRSTK